MCDVSSGAFRVPFNPQLRVEFGGAAVTADAGRLLPREADERLGLSALIEQHLTDRRTVAFDLIDSTAQGGSETRSGIDPGGDVSGVGDRGVVNRGARGASRAGTRRRAPCHPTHERREHLSDTSLSPVRIERPPRRASMKWRTGRDKRFACPAVLGMIFPLPRHEESTDEDSRHS